MKALLIIIFLSLSIQLLAPGGVRYGYIKAEDAINGFERLWWAICYVETRHNADTWVIDINGLPSVGISCIQEPRVRHYNRLTGKSYTLADCLSIDVSKEIFMFFAEGKTFEQASKDWNGSGAMTIAYWEKVKKAL